MAKLRLSPFTCVGRGPGGRLPLFTGTRCRRLLPRIRLVLFLLCLCLLLGARYGLLLYLCRRRRRIRRIILCDISSSRWRRRHILCSGGPVQEARLGGPAGVSLGGEHLHALAAGDVEALLGEGGRRRALVPQPLVPHGRDLDVREVRGPRVLDDAAPARVVGRGLERGRVRGGGGRGAARQAEDPVGVALEVGAWRGG